MKNHILLTILFINFVQPTFAMEDEDREIVQLMLGQAIKKYDFDIKNISIMSRIPQDIDQQELQYFLDLQEQITEKFINIQELIFEKETILLTKNSFSWFNISAKLRDAGLRNKEVLIREERQKICALKEERELFLKKLSEESEKARYVPMLRAMPSSHRNNIHFR